MASDPTDTDLPTEEAETEPVELAPVEPFPSPLAPAPQPEEADPEPDWLRLHPMSLLVNLIPMAWRTLRGTWPIALAILWSGDWGEGMAFELVLIGLFALTAASTTVIHYLTLRYRIRDGRLEVKKGLLNRESRIIDPARIQNIELVENLFHKWAGLVELRLETAGGTSTEGLLSALSREEAKRLRTELETHARRAVHEGDPDDEDLPTLTALGVPELLAYGLTQRRLGTVALLMAVGAELLNNLGPRAVEDVAQAMEPRLLFAVFLLAFAGSWSFSAVAALLKHWKYTLRQRGSTLITAEGLTTRRRVEIPLRKVQLVRIDEPLLRRLMGFGTVSIETAGLGFRDGQLRQAEGMVPMVEQARLGGLSRAAAPLADIDPWSAPLKPAARRALYRTTMQRVIRSVILAGVLTALVYPYGAVAFVMVPLAFPVAYLDWKAQGWLVTDSAVVSRRGFFTRQTWVISRDKLQSVHLIQGPLMRWHKLGRLAVRVAGSSVPLPDIHHEEALNVLADLAPSEPDEMPTSELVFDLRLLRGDGD